LNKEIRKKLLWNILTVFIIFTVNTVLFEFYGFKLDYITIFFIPAILIGVKYGSTLAPWVITVSTTFWILYIKFSLSEKLNFHDYSNIFLMILLTMFSSDIATKNIRSKWKAEGALNEVNEKLNEISKKYILLNKAYENITRKMIIINAQINTILNDYKVLKQTSIEALYSETLYFFNRHNSILDAGIYLLKDEKFILKAVSGNYMDYNKELDVKNCTIIKLCIEKHTIITIKDILKNPGETLKPDSIIMAIPIIYKKNNFLGILIVKKISFVAMNDYNISLINTVLTLIADVIYEKEFLPLANNDNFYSKELLIYTGKYFYEKVFTYINYVQKFPGYIFTLAFIKINNADLLDQTVLKIRNILFSSDFIAILDDENHLIGICLNLMDSSSKTVFNSKLEHALEEIFLTSEDYNLLFMEYSNDTKNPEIPSPGELNELLS